MSGSRRSPALVVVGTALTGMAVGIVVGVLWWLITPDERWIKLDGGLGAAELTSPSWFAADGWFLILGLLGGLVLAGVTWVWARRNPIAVVVGVVLGSALLSLVAWSVGGVLGPPDPNDAAASLAVGATVNGSLGLRATGVLAAPVVSALTLVVLLLAMAPVRADTPPAVPHEPDDPVAS